MREISKLSGKTSVFPDRKAPNSITHKGEKIVLTQKEKQEWQKVEGEYVNEMYDEFLKDIDNFSEKEAIRFAKRLEEIKRRAGEKAKGRFLKIRIEIKRGYDTFRSTRTN